MQVDTVLVEKVILTMCQGLSVDAVKEAFSNMREQPGASAVAALSAFTMRIEEVQTKVKLGVPEQLGAGDYMYAFLMVAAIMNGSKTEMFQETMATFLESVKRVEGGNVHNIAAKRAGL